LALGSLALALAVAACGLFIFTKSSRTSHVSLSSVVCAAGTRAPRASNQKDLAMHSSLFVFVMARSSDCAVVAATNFVTLSSWVSAPAVSPSSWSRTSDTTTSYVPYGRESRVGCSRSAIYGIWYMAIGDWLVMRDMRYAIVNLRFKEEAGCYLLYGTWNRNLTHNKKTKNKNTKRRRSERIERTRRRRRRTTPPAENGIRTKDQTTPKKKKKREIEIGDRREREREKKKQGKDRGHGQHSNTEHETRRRALQLQKATD
jgi:hypothetical protein